MIKINLLPVAASKKKEKIVNQLILGALVVIATLGALAYRYIVLDMAIADTDKNIATLNSDLGRLAEVQRQYEEQQAKARFLEQQKTTIDKLRSYPFRNWFIRVLDKVSESAPRDEISIEQITYKGNIVTVKGYSKEERAITKFRGELSIIPCESEQEICNVQRENCGIFQMTKKININDPNVATKQIEFAEKDYFKCRDFYKRQDEDEQEICVKKAQDLATKKASVCKTESKECTETKEMIAQVALECNVKKAEKRELHLMEYIKYDSVGFPIITRATLPGTKFVGYRFEISMQATEAPTSK